MHHFVPLCATMYRSSLVFAVNSYMYTVDGFLFIKEEATRFIADYSPVRTKKTISNLYDTLTRP